MGSNETLSFSFVCNLDHGPRIDTYLAAQEECQQMGISRAQLSIAIKNGKCSVNDLMVVKVSHRLMLNDIIKISIQLPSTNIEADPSVEFEILFEDESIIVLNKPAHLVVHPAPGVKEPTLVHGLVHRLSAEMTSGKLAERPGIVHRLDKGTSGVMVVAKTLFAMNHLQKQLQMPKTMKRKYHAVVLGSPRRTKYFPFVPPENKEGLQIGYLGEIIAPIGRHEKNRLRFAVDGHAAKEARTTIFQIGKGDEYRLIECHLDTGRTHQIRVHLESIGMSILGDEVYKGSRSKKEVMNCTSLGIVLTRPMLHAVELAFIHPITSKEVVFFAEYPKDMKEVVVGLNF